MNNQSICFKCTRLLDKNILIENQTEVNPDAHIIKVETFSLPVCRANADTMLTVLAQLIGNEICIKECPFYRSAE